MTSSATPAPSTPAPSRLAPGAGADPQHEVSDLAADLRVACGRISRRVRYESRSALAPHQFSVLVRLLHEGAKTPTQLADIERVSGPSMTRTVRCLEDEGLVARTKDPADGRQVFIDLTDAGRDAVDRTRTERTQWLAEHLTHLTPQERATLRAATDLLLEVAAR